MKKKDAIMDLIGKVVLVDPTQDIRSPSRKGQSCIVQDIALINQATRMYVAFADGDIDYFPPEHLLVLKSKREMLHELSECATKNISTTDYQWGIHILQLTSNKEHVEALMCATMGKPSDTMDFRKSFVDTCMDWVVKREDQRLKKFKQMRRGI